MAEEATNLLSRYLMRCTQPIDRTNVPGDGYASGSAPWDVPLVVRKAFEAFQWSTMLQDGFALPFGNHVFCHFHLHSHLFLECLFALLSSTLPSDLRNQVLALPGLAYSVQAPCMAWEATLRISLAAISLA